MRHLKKIMHTILEIETFSHWSTSSSTWFPFGPFNCKTQRRWKKRVVVTAQTRLEGQRTRDLKLDKLMSRLNQLSQVLILHRLMSTRKRGTFVSLQLISRWNNIVGLNIATATFLRKYPHIFEVFTHSLRRNICCKIRREMLDLIEEEDDVIRESELDNVQRIKKLLMMSINGTLHIHALRLIRRELGLPKGFRESILGKYTNEFRLIDLEIVAMVDRGDELGVAEVEKWREKEFREKWLSEFETKYAFPINLPTGFKIEAGSRERLKNWQRLSYIKPYERKEVVRIRTCGGIERFEKRAVGILHEFLSLTVGKMVEVKPLVHFRRDLGIEINLLELILKHPGIFYLCTKGNTQTVFLREAYSRGCLIASNRIYDVRGKMLDLLLMGHRNTRELRCQKEIKHESHSVAHNENEGGTRDGDWVIPLLDNLKDQSNTDELSEMVANNEKELN